MIRNCAIAFGAALITACTEPLQHGPAVLDAAATPYAEIDLAAYLDCAREHEVALLQAHRAGDRPGAAENSIAAIIASLADGAVFIEVDVARTADGVLILMHDDTLDRTTTGAGPVTSVTFKDLSGVTLVDVTGSDTGEPVPTLADAIDALEGRGIAQIDRKRSATVDAIAGVIEAKEAVGRVVVITYSIEEAIAVYRRLPGVMVSTGIDSLEDVEALQSAGVPLDRVVAWLGTGMGDPSLDAKLAALGIETSYGDFRAEGDGSVDYQRMADNGAEVLSVDNVAAASSALDTAASLATLRAACN